MPHRRIGIVVAMAREVEPLLRGSRKVSRHGLQFFEFGGAVVVVGGIGRKAARHAAEVVAERYDLSALVSAGVAGALTDQGRVGDVFRVRTVVDAASGRSFAAEGPSGSVVTVAAVSGEAAKRALAAEWQADVVDMEASAVAEVAERHTIPFAAVKAVSDELSFAMPPVGEYVNEAGKFQTLRFAAFLATHPRWWGAVRQLNHNSRQAAVKLSESLQHLMDQRLQVEPKGNFAGN